MSRLGTDPVTNESALKCYGEVYEKTACASAFYLLHKSLIGGILNQKEDSMYSYVRCFVVVSFLFTITHSTSTGSLAQEGKAKSAESSVVKKIVRIPFRGKIHSVNKEAMTITLDGKVRKRTLQLIAKTKIVKHGKPASFRDALVGEEVGGQIFRHPDGREEVYSIRLGPKPGSKKKSENKAASTRQKTSAN